MMKKISLMHKTSSPGREPEPNHQNLPLFGHNRKDSSQGFTNFETYPQNQFDPQENSDLMYKNEPSICPSIEENMGDMDQYLEDLSNELKIKTSALRTAEEYIEVLHDNLQEANTKLKTLQSKYTESLSQITKLESELGYLKSTSKNEDTGKKSITRTVITDANIPYQGDCEPLVMISNQIFSEFAHSYYQLVEQLSSWIEKETQEQREQGIIANQLEMEDMLFQFPQASSTLSNNHYGSTSYPNKSLNLLDESYIPNYYNHSKSQANFGTEPTTAQEYEKIIKMYSEYSHRIYSMLCECVNKMSTLTNTLDTYSTSSCSSPRTVVPPQLFDVIVREVSEIYAKKNRNLKKENQQLREILDSLVGWLQKNGKSTQLDNFSFCSKKPSSSRRNI